MKTDGIKPGWMENGCRAGWTHCQEIRIDRLPEHESLTGIRTHTQQQNKNSRGQGRRTKPLATYSEYTTTGDVLGVGKPYRKECISTMKTINTIKKSIEGIEKITSKAIMDVVLTAHNDAKVMEKGVKEITAKTSALMLKYLQKTDDGKYVSAAGKITLVRTKESVTVDLKALEASEPDLYRELLDKYPKVTAAKEYIR